MTKLAVGTSNQSNFENPPSHRYSSASPNRGGSPKLETVQVNYFSHGLFLSDVGIMRPILKFLYFIEFSHYKYIFYQLNLRGRRTFPESP